MSTLRNISFLQKFLDSSKLKRHFLIHTGERDFVCPHEGCGKVINQFIVKRSVQNFLVYSFKLSNKLLLLIHFINRQGRVHRLDWLFRYVLSKL